MIAFDTSSLPKTVTQQNAADLVGESVYWYCTACKQWRTSIIQEGGAITCSVCGSSPDAKHTPTLAYQSRYKLVSKLCAPGAEWRAHHDDLVERYGDFLEATWRSLPVCAKQTGYKYFGAAWREIDGLGDYLLTAPDVPVVDAPHAYTESGLKRRYSRPGRRCNMTSLSDLRLPYMTDDDGRPYSAEEVAETLSFTKGYSRPACGEYFADDLLDRIPDERERKVAYALSRGATKRDVQRRFGLSEAKVRTIVRHLAKYLK